MTRRTVDKKELLQSADAADTFFGKGNPKKGMLPGGSKTRKEIVLA